MEILVATNNPGKMREYRALLSALPVRVRFPHELGIQVEVEETEPTYLDNAMRKARIYAQISGRLTLADDSGLEVDALEGEPGVRSARYVPGTDADRIAALLARLEGVPWERRTARFRCVIAIASPEGILYTTEGVCEGYIANAPAGTGGFGYDPIFYLPEFGRTMAELPAEVKNRISHRARAVEAALPVLQRLIRLFKDLPGAEEPLPTAPLPVPLEHLQRQLNYTFRDRGLLLRALTHPSYLHEHPEAGLDNQRLEFLGDAVLSLTVAEWIYHRYPEFREGEMTRLRAALVSEESLARFATQLGVGSALRLGRGEEERGGRERPANLCDAFEALIGALYLDGGLEPVQALVRTLVPPIAETILAAEADRDPKSRFQEWAQAELGITPRYRIVAEYGPDHAKTFVAEVLLGDQVAGRGEGPSKQAAEQAAARNAWEAAHGDRLPPHPRPEPGL